MAAWLSLFFVLSGFCGLVYQVVWLRLTMASFGVTSATTAILVSVFMAGLALGSWGAGWLARRLAGSRPATVLQLYASAEAVVSVSSFAVLKALPWERQLLAQWGVAQWASYGYYTAAGALIALLLLPFCAAMGTTFPLAMWAIRTNKPEEAERSFGRLYAANVVGAMLGTLLSAFVLIELLGLSGCLLLAATINAVVAVGAFVFSLQLRGAPALQPAVPVERVALAPPSSYLITLFATGFVSLGMEIVWMRQFTAYLGNLVYSFAAIVASYLAATFVGAVWYRRRRWDDLSGGALHILWVAVALAALLPALAADPRVTFWNPPAALGTPGNYWLGLLRVAIGVMPFCGLLGFLTPLLVDRHTGGEPHRAGRAYAVNVLGCILGPLVAGFVLLPLLPERWSLALLALPLASLPLLFERSAATGARRFGRLLAGPAAGVIALGVALVARDSVEPVAGVRVLRDHTATVTAFGQGRGKKLLVNGLGMTVLVPVTKLMVHLPLAAHREPPRDVLIVCFGMGTSFRSAMAWDTRVTAVELVPSVPRLFGFYHPGSRRLLRSPQARLVIDDGRRFLELTQDSFDVITVDPPPPVEAAGSSLLYSMEFYAAAEKRLRPGGVLQAWVPDAEPYIAGSFVRALVASFAHVRFFHSIEGWGLHMLASREPFEDLSAEELAARMPEAARRDLVEWYPGADSRSLFASLMSHEVPLAEMLQATAGIPPLRDDRPQNEYFLLRRSGLLEGAAR